MISQRLYHGDTRNSYTFWVRWDKFFQSNVVQ